MCVCAHICGDQRITCGGQFLSFYHVGHRNWNQLIRPGSRCFTQLVISLAPWYLLSWFLLPTFPSISTDNVCPEESSGSFLHYWILLALFQNPHSFFYFRDLKHCTHPHPTHAIVGWSGLGRFKHVSLGSLKMHGEVCLPSNASQRLTFSAVYSEIPALLNLGWPLLAQAFGVFAEAGVTSSCFAEFTLAQLNQTLCWLKLTS